MMRVIDFLPADYAERRGRRRANLICLGLAGAAVLALGMISALAVARAMGVTALRRVVELQYREAGRQIEQLKKLEERKAGLLRKVELSADLLERVPRSYILARLTNALPPYTSIQIFIMSTEEVEVEVPAPSEAVGKADETGKDRSAQKGAKKKRPEKVKKKETLFRIDGLAPTDVEVAEYIARLSADPLFEEVNLKFSEEFPYQEGLQVRRFELSFRLSPKAEKWLESNPAGGLEMPVSAPPPSEGL